MHPRSDPPLARLRDFVDRIGEPCDPEQAREEHRFAVGSAACALLRDCHGVLRRVDVRFAGPPFGVLAAIERLGLGAPTPIVAGELFVLDVARLGKIYVQPGRVSVQCRFVPERERVERLLAACVEGIAGADEFYEVNR